jgi:hypothetical protein
MTWNPNPPAYSDAESRDAASAGYLDGYKGKARSPGVHPVQPYSRAYWEGRADSDNVSPYPSAGRGKPGGRGRKPQSP